MKFQRPSGKIQNEIAAKQPMLRVLDYGEKTDGGLGFVFIWLHANLPINAAYLKCVNYLN